MVKSFNPYLKTIDKLTTTKLVLQETLITGNYDKAESNINLYREYKDCYFCIAWRTQLDGRDDGICDACPCHKLAEEVMGRNLSCNGCYKVTYYRELVRLAYWFKQDKSRQVIEALIKAIDGTIGHMNQYRVRIDKDIIVKE